MSTFSETGASNRRGSSRRSSVLTGVLVATLLVAASVVGRAAAHDSGTTSHLWEHFKALKVAGTINADTNPVDWTKLKGVPGGLADGVDDGVTVAGFGLNKVFTAFYVDPEEVQKRVVTACPSGQAIRSISQAGTAVCAPVSQALITTDADTGIICNAWCVEGSLTLPPGTWAITAKIVINQDDIDEDELIFECQLHAGGVFDEGRFVISDGRIATVSTQVVATVAQGGNLTAALHCQDRDYGDSVGRNLSIMAIRVGG